MPQLGWRCVFSDAKKTFQECIECSKTPEHCEFTPEMLALMRKQTSTGRKNPLAPSVTALLRDCMRQTVIQDRVDYWVNPRRQWNLFRGNLVHQILEGAPINDGWKEVFHERPLTLPDGTVITIRGKTDKIVLGQLLIRDYKSTRRLPTKTRSGYGNHALQLNVYRWLWWPVFHAEKLRLQYVDMSGTKIVKVDLMDIDEVEKLILERAQRYVTAMRAPEIPPAPTTLDKWVCNYDDVKDVCQEKEKEDSSGEDTVKTTKAGRRTGTKKTS